MLTRKNSSMLQCKSIYYVALSNNDIFKTVHLLINSLQHKKILTESKGNLYGPQLEVAFLEILRTKEFTDGDSQTLDVKVKEVAVSPEKEGPAPKLNKLDDRRRFSQIIMCQEDVENVMDLEEKAKNATKEKFVRNKLLLSSTWETVRNRNAFKFLIAVDGSSESEAAAQVAMSLRKPVDHVTLLHIYSGNDQNDSSRLPKLYRQKAVHTKFDTLTTTLCGSVPERCSFSWIQKDDGTSPREIFLDHLKNENKDYNSRLLNNSKVVVSVAKKSDIDVYSTDGNSNWKMTKENTNKLEIDAITDEIDTVGILEKCKHPVDFVVLGHAGRKSAIRPDQMLTAIVDLALHDIKSTVILVNQPPRISSARDTPVGKKVVMAVNESDCSKKGLKILLTLMHPQDTLILIYVNQENTNSNKLFDNYSYNSLRDIQTYYEKEIVLFGPINSSFTVIGGHQYQYQESEKVGSSKKRLSVGSLSLSFKSTLVGNSEEELEQATARATNRLYSSRSMLSARTINSPRTLPPIPNELSKQMSARGLGLSLSTKIPFEDSLTSSKGFGDSVSSRGLGFGDPLRSSRGYGDSMSSKVIGHDSASKKYLASNKPYSHDSSEGETDNEDTFEITRNVGQSLTVKLIIDFINVKQAESPPDFFAIAPRPRGLGDSTVGGLLVTESIISQLDCNIIILKNQS